MGVKKILVGLLEENRQLKEDNKKYERLVLDQEQKIWALEDKLKELQVGQRPSRTLEDENRRLRAKVELLTERHLSLLDGTEIEASMDIDDPDNPFHTKAEEPIVELEDDYIDTLTPEQDCGD